LQGLDAFVFAAGNYVAFLLFPDNASRHLFCSLRSHKAITGGRQLVAGEGRLFNATDIYFLQPRVLRAIEHSPRFIRAVLYT
jgi:hypothetical protein